MKETIFTRHYPRIDPAEALRKADEEYADASKLPDYMQHTREEDMRLIERKYSYQPNPDKVSEAEYYVAFSKYLCITHEVDTEITQDDISVKADFWIPFSLYDGKVKEELVTLLIMADELSFAPDKSWPYGFVVSTTYYTADLYVNGEKREI